MPKAGKQSAQSGTARKSRKNSAKNQNAPSKGRLIALEGTRGKDLTDAGRRLARMFSDEDITAGCSTWDSSNTFYELGMGKVKNPAAPVRSLLLLYASDLMFRLRWEIEPALKEGLTVVAAPYVESAIAIGVAGGLPVDWLHELFSFALKPDACFRLKEKPRKNIKKNPGKKSGKAATGFVEFCCASLAASSPVLDRAEFYGGVLRYLDGLADRKQITTVGKKLKNLAEAALT
jgi:thymidylate kinase